MAGSKPDEHGEQNVSLPELPSEARHEQSDINVWAVGKFAIVLVILCIGTLLLLFGLLRYFLAEYRQPPPANTAAGRLPPEPRLQTEPTQDLLEMRAGEERILNSYGWVDPQKGIVRIPIERAIDLLVQRGLPSRAQPGPESTSRATVPTESGLGPIMIRPGGPLAEEK